MAANEDESDTNSATVTDADEDMIQFDADEVEETNSHDKAVSDGEEDENELTDEVDQSEDEEENEGKDSGSISEAVSKEMEMSDTDTDDLDDELDSLQDVGSVVASEDQMNDENVEEEDDSMAEIRAEVAKRENMITMQSEKIAALSEINKKHRLESSRLSTSLESTETLLEEALKREKELTKQLESYSDTNIPNKLERIRLQKENESLLEEKNNFEKDLEKKNNSILELRRKVDEQQLLLKDKEQQMNLKLSHYNSEQERSQKYEQELLENIKTLKISLSQVESASNEEKESLLRSIEVYKQKEKASQERINSLENNLKTVKEELDQSVQKFNEVLEQKESIYETNLLNAKAETLREVDRLVEELKKTKEDLNESNKIILSLTSEGKQSYSASMVIKDTSSNLSSMISQLVTLKETRTVQENEIRFLNSTIDTLRQELGEKQPLLEEMKVEYDKLLKTFYELNEKYEQKSGFVSELKLEVKMLNSQKTLLEEESQRFKQQNEDLSSQVVSLLKKNQDKSKRESDNGSGLLEAPTGAQEPLLGSIFGNSFQPNRAQNLVSNNLVEFRNIEELQQKNQELLQTIRKLTKDLDARDEEGGDIESQLRTVNTEFREVQMQRKRQEELILSITKQRDLYKSLVIEREQNEKNLQLTESRVSRQDVEKVEVKYNSLVKEKEEIEKESKEMNEKLKQEVYELSKKVAILETERDFYEKKFQSLDKKLKFEEGESNRLRADVAAASRETDKCEMLLKEKQLEFETLSEREKKVSTGFNNMKSEVKLLKEENKQVNKLYSELKDQRDRQDEMLATFQVTEKERRKEEERVVSTLRESIENLKESNRDQQRHKMKEIKDLQIELSRFKVKADEEEQKAKEAFGKLDSVNKILSETKKDLERVMKEKNLIEEQLKETNKVAQQVRLFKVDHARNRLESEKVTKDGELDDEALTQKIKQLQEEVVSKAEALITLQTIASSAENALNDLKKVTDKEKEELNSKLKSMSEKVSELTTDRAKLSNTVEQSKVVIRNLRSQMEELKEKSKALELELNKEKEKLKQMQREIKDTEEGENSFEEKYEREVKLHSETVARIGKIRNELIKVRKERSKFQEELTSLEVLSKQGVKQLEAEKESFKRQNNNLKLQTLESQRQAELLTEQVKQLTGQVSNLQKEQVDFEDDKLIDNAHNEGDAEEIKRLRELLAITTKQKDSAVLGEEEYKVANIRLTSQVAELKTEVEQLAAKVAEQKGQVLISPEQKATFDGALDENKVLKTQNTSLSTKLKGLEQELAQKTEAVTSAEEKLAVSQHLQTAHEQLKKESAEKEARLRTEIESREKRLEEMQKLKEEEDKVRTESEKSKEELDELQEKLKVSEETKVKLREAARKYRTNFRESEQQVKSLTTEIDQLQSKLEAAQKTSDVEVKIPVAGQKREREEKDEVVVVDEEPSVVSSTKRLKPSVSLLSPVKDISKQDVPAKAVTSKGPVEQTTELVPEAKPTPKKLTKQELLKLKLKKQREQRLKKKREAEEQNNS